MDKLGERVIRDRARAEQLQLDADRMEAQAAIMRREAIEILRVLEMVRLSSSRS